MIAVSHINPRTADKNYSVPLYTEKNVTITGSRKLIYHCLFICVDICKPIAAIQCSAVVIVHVCMSVGYDTLKLAISMLTID